MTLCAQMKVGVQRVVFYNCENLFDTHDNPERQDDEFTPEGSRRWTSQCLELKLNHLAQVLAGAGQGEAPMLIGVAEVENDEVMQGLSVASPLDKWNYEYLITCSEDRRGINVGLFYQPLTFQVVGWRALRVALPNGRHTRDVLYVCGTLPSGDTLDVAVCHLPSRLGGNRRSRLNRMAAHATLRCWADSVTGVRSNPHLLVMGDMNDYPHTRLLRKDMCFGTTLVNLMERLNWQLKLGLRQFGSHKYAGRWGFLDQFWVSPNLVKTTNPDTLAGSRRIWIDNVDVVVFPFMLSEEEQELGHKPFRTYQGNTYLGGYSDHLPVRLDLHVGE